MGALAAYVPQTPSAALVRATEETAAWVSGQVELAELAHERTRTVEAELRALRAQISPHFVYNSLAAIASFVRTDPERARELLLEFADFTRYAFKAGGEFTTLAAELRNVERYLALEQARFGDRLVVSLLIAPEVLPVAVPYLAIQPLVENAVRHGLEGQDRPGPDHHHRHRRGHRGGDLGGGQRLGLRPRGDPAGALGHADADGSEADGVGLANVDARLRQVYGDDHGLVVETAVGRRHQGQLPGAEVRRRRARVLTRAVRTGRVRPAGARIRSYSAAVPAAAADHPTLRALVVDDEAHARSELAFLLRRDERIGDVHVAGTGRRGAAHPGPAHRRRRVLRHQDARHGRPGPGPRPHPVRPAAAGRLRHGVRRARGRRVRAAGHRLRHEAGALGPAGRGDPAGRRRQAPPVEGRSRGDDETIPVELGGVTRFVRRSEVRYVEAQGDYARLHTPDAAHLVRIPWPPSKSVGPQPVSSAIHRSTLVALPLHRRGAVRGRSLLGAGRRAATCR